MPLRQVVFAVLFGIVVALVMQHILGGQLQFHILVTVPAALAGGWFASRRREPK